MFARYRPLAKLNCLGERPEWAHAAGNKNGGRKEGLMVLDTNAFLIVMAAAIIAMAFVIWVMFKKVS
jgi:hypothetical protein